MRRLASRLNYQTMPKNITLEQYAARLLSLSEAVDWIGQNLEEFGLSRPPLRDTLKTAAQAGRLKAIRKGSIYVTRVEEIREYMRHYDPKNKTESRPVKRRAKRKVDDNELLIY